MTKREGNKVTELIRNYGSFGNVVLITLFIFFENSVGEKVCENTCNIV